MTKKWAAVGALIHSNVQQGTVPGERRDRGTGVTGGIGGFGMSKFKQNVSTQGPKETVRRNSRFP